MTDAPSDTTPSPAEPKPDANAARPPGEPKRRRRASKWWEKYPIGALFAAITIGTAITIAWGAYVLSVAGGRGTTYELGTFGDAFGPLTAIFNAAALAAAIVAVMLQRRELALQRVEMREAREEMKGQREELRRQRLAAQRHARAIERANEIALLAVRVEAARLACDAEERGAGELGAKSRDESPIEMFRQLSARHGTGRPTAPEEPSAAMSEAQILRDALYRRPRLKTFFDAHHRAVVVEHELERLAQPARLPTSEAGAPVVQATRRR